MWRDFCEKSRRLLVGGVVKSKVTTRKRAQKTRNDSKKKAKKAKQEHANETV